MTFFKKYFKRITLLAFIAIICITSTPNFSQDSGVNIRIIMKPKKKIYSPESIDSVKIQPVVPLTLGATVPKIEIKVAKTKNRHKPKLILSKKDK